MFAFLKKFILSIFGFSSDICDTEENLEKILSDIQRMENEEADETDTYDTVSKYKLGQSEPDEYEVEVFKCFHKNGKITHLCDEFGIIDESIYFEPDKVAKTLTLKEGDEVSYITFKKRSIETERVYKIYELRDEFWKCEQQVGESEKEGEINALSRLINGRVIEKRGRKLLIEPLNVWCNLDNINATYVPIEGDWVSLEAMVTVNREVVDLIGDILEIHMLKPLLSKSGVGRVTLWHNNVGEGVIEDQIFFSKQFCEGGYIPTLGDEVIYDAVESDQGRYKWRVIKVIPNGVTNNFKKILSNNDLEDLLREKNDIKIKPNKYTLQLKMNETKYAVFRVINTGTTEQILNCVRLRCSLNTSQLKLQEPDKKFNLKPRESVQITFECFGKFLGLSEEICIFFFSTFKIGKIFTINVTSNDVMNKLFSCDIDSTFISTKCAKKFIRNDLNDGRTFYGPRPWTPPKFIHGEKKGFYKIPDKLWDAVVGNSEFSKNKSESMRDLEVYAPYLKEDLNSSYYADRFHTLLYLEEISLKQNYRKYDQNGIFLQRKGDFLSVEVPDLTDQRPSLIVGDKLILKQPWSEQKNMQHVGYVFEIHQKEVLVKFHESFHQLYNQSECDITFEPALSSLMRAHDAINRGVKKLGFKWLFPTAVNEKPAQVNFETDVEFPENFLLDIKQLDCNVDDNGYIIPKMEKPKKKLVWFNKILNEKQKQAVINILKGHGRPLPYIVFGPPGTGKTSTLVEAVMQIYHLMPDSRILVTTPSNSAADLITERLIQMGEFKPGQIVRLVAFHRVAEDKIQLNLIPYCSLIDIGDDSGRPLNILRTKEKIKSSSLSQLTGRHRITIGTCTCVGLLHYMALPAGHFTHIIVDEAGQATEPDLLISASFLNVRNGQIVLVGDPQQLGPVCFSQLALTYGLADSLMQRFISTFPYQRDFESFSTTSGYDPRFISRLNMNYRSVPEILALPSQLFYDSELIPMVSHIDSLEGDIIKKFNFQTEKRDEPAAIIFHGIRGQNCQESDTPSWFNPHEVWQAVTYLKHLYDMGLTCDKVGIVTPYVKQVQKLRFLISELNLAVPKIGTVEEFQGQERYVIIVSTVRSSFSQMDTDIFRLMGFLTCPRRLNVALTRARALLIILGNPFVLSKNSYWKIVIEYCQKNNSYTGCSFMHFSSEEAFSKTEAN